MSDPEAAAAASVSAPGSPRSPRQPTTSADNPTQTAPPPTFPPPAVTTAPTTTNPESATQPMAPLRGQGLNGLDFTPIVTHYLFLVTFVLSIVRISVVESAKNTQRVLVDWLADGIHWPSCV